MESGDSEIFVHSSNFESLIQGGSHSVSAPQSDSHSDTHDFDSNKAVEGEEHNDDDSFEDEELQTETEMVLSTTANNSFDEGEADTCETPADVAFVKTKKEQNKIAEIIESTKRLRTSSIELSRKRLQSFPEMLLDLSNLEYMYLEGNEIAFLPDEFFKCFPHLLWLDLRNNLLSRIPSMYLSCHTCLRNLLLEGNNLRNLPLELGLVKSLHGLNIAGNPLDFPPQMIIETGTQGILQFLRDMIDAKMSAKMSDLDLQLSEDHPDSLEQISASSDDWNTTASMMDIARIRAQVSAAQHYGASTDSEVKPSISQLNERHHKKNKLKKTGELPPLERIKQMKESKMAWKVNHFPSPPTQEYVTFKMNEEKQMARVKEFQEKTDAILQRRKDDAMLKNWREEAKILQQKKYSKHFVPGEDFKEPVEQAPFDIDPDMKRVLSKEERLKADIQKEKKLKEQRNLSPATRHRIEEEKQARICELEKRIKDLTAGMVERRRQPKGSPQQEMEIARREMEMVKNLQRGLMQRYQELKAWTTARSKNYRDHFSRPASAGFRF
ncbi:leucine-rich repeat-containing protein 27-like isoform X2 [Physella acuta]|uniref:leucine-rich repeat-containing protein 27-like isoform X2 n=1 Tax=Physella acuta TaxID=109671 RepID=UPI0027DB65EE|nr:leucine-rich repeat-containing protein 27-like isoform X2 [Physella acuta]